MASLHPTIKFPAINRLFLAVKPSPLVTVAMAILPHASSFSLKKNLVSDSEIIVG